MFKQGDWVTVKPSKNMNKPGCTAQVVQVFEKADPVAYPRGLNLVNEPDKRGVFFCDNEGWQYGFPMGPEGFLTWQP